MAVYTHLGAEALGELICAFNVGDLVSAKGIAEGVSNSNWLIETTGKTGAGSEKGGARFILTMFEGRTEIADLPFFLGLLDHLADKNCPVPRTIHDRDGASFRSLTGPDGADKVVALIEFLPGVSVSLPTPAQAHAVGVALAQMHKAVEGYDQSRSNTLALPAWRELLEACKAEDLATIDPALGETVTQELAFLDANWPRHLPTGVVHADLFPDNVLMLGETVTGLIDFYFSCTDIIAYDVAVTHAAWCFDNAGRNFDPAISAALLKGYESIRPLSAGEREALPVLARGAAMRFLSTRAYDWINTPQDALVVRKDPLAFARRLAFYADPANAGVFA